MTASAAPAPRTPDAATTKAPRTWVVGGGGLLGTHLSDELSRRGVLWQPPGAVPWTEPDAADTLQRHAALFLADTGDEPWQVLWAAGAGVTGASAGSLETELAVLRATLSALGQASDPRDGAVFLASSAGGVYAGVGDPPYDERSPVRPLAAYGEAKLEAERLLAHWSAATGTPSLTGRIANLYGPGQNLTKAQGLISQLCRSYLTAQPLSIYVSLDTLRDYVFGPDCARLVADALDVLRRRQRGTADTVIATKVIASQRAVTIGAVLGEMRRVFRRTPRIVIGSSPVAALQARDLSLRSVVWPQVDRQAHTPLPVGIHATAADLRRRLQAGWEGGR